MLLVAPELLLFVTQHSPSSMSNLTGMCSSHVARRHVSLSPVSVDIVFALKLSLIEIHLLNFHTFCKQVGRKTDQPTTLNTLSIARECREKISLI